MSDLLVMVLGAAHATMRSYGFFPNWGCCLVLLLAPAGFGVFVVMLVGFERRRARHFARAVQRAAWVYSGEYKEWRESGLNHLPLMQTGRRSGQVLNFSYLPAEKGRWFVADFWYDRNGTNRPRGTTLVGWRQNGMCFPAAAIWARGAAEGWLGRLAGQGLGPDALRVTVDGDPRFAERFEVYAKDEHALTGWVEGAATHALAQAAQWSVEATGDWIVAYRFRHLTAPRDLARDMDLGRRLLQPLIENWVRRRGREGGMAKG